MRLSYLLLSLLSNAALSHETFTQEAIENHTKFLAQYLEYYLPILLSKNGDTDNILLKNVEFTPTFENIKTRPVKSKKVKNLQSKGIEDIRKYLLSFCDNPENSKFTPCHTYAHDHLLKTINNPKISSPLLSSPIFSLPLSLYLEFVLYSLREANSNSYALFHACEKMQQFGLITSFLHLSSWKAKDTLISMCNSYYTSLLSSPPLSPLLSPSLDLNSLFPPHSENRRSLVYSLMLLQNSFFTVVDYAFPKDASPSIHHLVLAEMVAYSFRYISLPLSPLQKDWNKIRAEQWNHLLGTTEFPSLGDFQNVFSLLESFKRAVDVLYEKGVKNPTYEELLDKLTENMIARLREEKEKRGEVEEVEEIAPSRRLLYTPAGETVGEGQEVGVKIEETGGNGRDAETVDESGRGERGERRNVKRAQWMPLQSENSFTGAASEGMGSESTPSSHLTRPTVRPYVSYEVPLVASTPSDNVRRYSPSANILFPSSRYANPSQNVVRPFETREQSSQDYSNPTNPFANNIYPFANNIYPSANRVNPDSNKVHPFSDYFYSQHNSINPSANSFPSANPMFPPANNFPSANYYPSASTMFPLANNFPSANNLFPSYISQEATDSQFIPPLRDGRAVSCPLSLTQKIEENIESLAEAKQRLGEIFTEKQQANSLYSSSLEDQARGQKSLEDWNAFFQPLFNNMEMLISMQQSIASECANRANSANTLTKEEETANDREQVTGEERENHQEESLLKKEVKEEYFVPEGALDGLLLEETRDDDISLGEMRESNANAANNSHLMGEIDGSPRTLLKRAEEKKNLRKVARRKDAITLNLWNPKDKAKKKKRKYRKDLKFVQGITGPLRGPFYGEENISEESSMGEMSPERREERERQRDEKTMKKFATGDEINMYVREIERLYFKDSESSGSEERMSPEHTKKLLQQLDEMYNGGSLVIEKPRGRKGRGEGEKETQGRKKTFLGKRPGEKELNMTKDEEEECEESQQKNNTLWPIIKVLKKEEGQIKME